MASALPPRRTSCSPRAAASTSPPEEAVTFTHSAAGVAAGQAAGLTVVALGEGPQEELLRGFGAERVVSSLNTLLDFRLR